MTVTEATTTTTYPDISEFQSNANIGTFVSNGGTTLCARAHNGFRPDNCFPGRLTVMRSSGLYTRIYYQYLVAGGDPVWQAHALMSVIGEVLPGELIMLDYEEGTVDAVGRAQAWFGIIDPWQKGQYGAMLYTGEYFLNAHLGGAAAWTGRPLVLAKYGQPEPTEPHTVWQLTDGVYNGPISFPGIGYCDGNLHHGSTQDLQIGLGGPGVSAASASPGPAPAPPHPTLTAPIVTGMVDPAGGYWLVGADGNVYGYGTAQTKIFGTLVGHRLNGPIVAAFATPDGNGYTLVATDGGVFTFGTAQFHGSTGAMHLNAPVHDAFSTPDGGGYWLIAGDGGVFTFGDAPFDGSEGGKRLNGTVVGGSCFPDGKGYWLVATDGGVFTFGDAPFKGSTGGQHLNAPVVSMAPAHDGNGYWLGAADGGVFTFGDTTFYGSEGSVHLAKPVVDIAATPTGQGYYLFASDGGVFTFGDAVFHGSAA